MKARTAVRIEKVITEGTFRLDGGTWAVDNNVWLVGDDDEVLVIDAAHDADAIEEAVGGRRVTAIACTHGHSDHINAAPELADRTGAPILLHPEDRRLWKMTHADRSADGDLAHGMRLTVGGVKIICLHTPGHSPGSVSFYVPALNTVFAGDTLFAGGPGPTGTSFSEFPTLVESIRSKLLTLPADTSVRTGHGAATTVGGEAPDLQAWLAREC
ncbi:MBL fold metallo-hydrolase [Streptomyces sp. NPDC054864]